MNFPDLNHFLQLRKDLWHWPGSRAALMVGAGMSLNAKPAPGTHTRFPTWRQLTKAMFDEIYPVSDDPVEQQTREERLNSMSPLRVASEYDAAFGPSSLSSFIRTHIPDTDHHPGPTHELMLQLPWRDVFTTNYDTLLERTEVAGRAYSPVTTALDLTTAFSPRIIKLHGSFPSQTPFIITEEHYRTYPTFYAPFVNTVRQSLIENSLVLLGFSGDDPNFLQWTGWIRDELANHHAPIYLVGRLSLDNVQRSLLSRRGVTPIDLSPIVVRSAAPEDSHASTLEWFLSCLLSGRPKRPERWLETSVPQETNDDGPSCPVVGLSEPEQPSIHSVGKLSDDTVEQLAKRWRFERLGYPGWLVATHELRASLWRNTSILAARIFEWITRHSSAESIGISRELNWRIETSMIPIFDDFRTPFETVVDDLFPMNNDTERSKNIPSIFLSDSQNAIAWLELAFALLRHARENYDAERWESLEKRIALIVVKYPQFTDRHYYEQALWRMWNIDRSGAREVLERWSPPTHSPLALMWKAGLLAELDELTESRTLLRAVLRDVRRSLHNKPGQHIDLLSLEGWCTYLLFAVEQALEFPGLTRRSELREEFLERWQELNAWDCNPWPLTEYFEHVLSAPPATKKERRRVARGFDPGQATVSHSIGGPDSVVTASLPAFARIRLYEQVGIPMRLRFVGISGDTLRNACKWTLSLTNFWSPTLLIRAGKKDDINKHHFMDRTQVAAMDRSLATRLGKWAMEALKREFPSRSPAGATDNSWDSLLEALVEVLSRLTVRMEPSELQDAFDIALSIYRRPEVYSNLTLNRTCSDWFSRLFVAASDDQLADWTPELLRFPLSPQRNPSITPWPDPMRSFPTDRVNVTKDTVSNIATEIDTSIEWLLRRARSESGEGRETAIVRLSLACIAGLMSEGNSESFGTLLWDSIDATEVPQIPGYSCFGLLHLPHPAHIDVIGRIKKRLLSRPIERIVSVASGRISVSGRVVDAMIDLAAVTKPIVGLIGDFRGGIEWNHDERENLWTKAIDWWENEKRALSMDHDLVTSYLVRNIRMLGLFMQRLVPTMDLSDDDEWNRVASILSVARDNRVYLTTVLPYCLMSRSTEKEEVERTILGDLVSQGEDRAQAGAEAVRHWIHLAAAGVVGNPPIEIVEELIRAVAFRRSTAIRSFMEQLSFLLFEMGDAFSVDQVKFLVSSLPAWEEAIQIPTVGDSVDGFPEEERSELRVRLAELGSILGRWLELREPEEPEPVAISRLRESYATDNLPEVRRAFDKWERLALAIEKQGE